MTEENNTKDEILDSFIDFIKNNKNLPTWNDLPFSRSTIRTYYSNMFELKLAAKEKEPKAFSNIFDETDFTKENHEKIVKAVNKAKVYVITTIVSGGETHLGCLDALKYYCDERDAELILLPCKTPATGSTGASNFTYMFGPELSNEHIVFADLNLNSNIMVSGLKISSKMMNPTTGTKRLAKDCSFIFGSPKQSLEVVPNDKNKLPHVVMSTGTITKKEGLYQPSDEKAFNAYLSKRSEYFAERHHKMGAIIVECDVNEKYYFRQVQFDEDGGFVDLGVFYTPKKTKYSLRPTGFIWGDLHFPNHDPKVFEVSKQMCYDLKPIVGVIHDGFDACTITPHNEHKHILRAKNPMTLGEELRLTAQGYMEICKLHDKVIDAPSNHNNMLARYLESGRWLKEPQNLRWALRLAEFMLNNSDPFEIAMRYMMSKESLAKMQFLKPDEGFKLSGFQTGLHGDKGPNGSKGSLKNLEYCFDSIIVGHSHTPGIYGNAWQVGCNCLMEQGYNIGPSSWMHTNGVIYPGGFAQLLNIIDGKYKL